MKILIVDDEPLVRRSLGKALRLKGHEVFEAVDGSLGLEEWQAKNPDLVFLDVLMPGLTGPQVLEAIGPLRQAKVILMSAYAGDHNVDSDPNKGADLFLPKPFDDIFAVVRQAEELVK